MKTTIFNDTTQVFNLQIGNANVYMKWHMVHCRLDPGKSIMVEVDHHGSYFEYVFKDEATHSLFDGLESKTKQTIITSDDFAEWAAITFYITPRGSVSWRGTIKRTSLPNRQVFKCIHTPHCMYSRVQ